MKRKRIIIALLAMMAMTSLAVFHLKINTSGRGLMDISLTNVDVLAQESGTPPECVQLKGLCVDLDKNIIYDYLSFK